MKIVCIMPIFGREEITLKTIEWLGKQTYPFHKIVLIGSKKEDRNTFKKSNVKNLVYFSHKNHPLSNKVQYGVKRSKIYEPDAILINGSDSWLSPNWNKRVKYYLENGADLIGKTHSVICSVEPNKKIKIIAKGYDPNKRKDPFGSGRTFSKRVLDLLNWKLFPSNLDRNLDGRSYRNLMTNVKNVNVVLMNNDDDACIFGIKSSTWETITPFEKLNRTDKKGSLMEVKSISNKKNWLNNNFPGWKEDLKEIIPSAIM